MAETILGTLMSPVGVTISDSETSSRVMADLKVIRATVDAPTEVTSKPIQSSGTSSDAGNPVSGGGVASDLAPAKVVRPYVVELEGILETSDAISEVIKYHDDPSVVLTMMIKSIFLKGMAINAVNLRYSGEHLNVAVARISFEQVIPMPYESSTKVEQDGDSDTYGFGVQQPTGIASTVSDYFSGMAEKLGF